MPPAVALAAVAVGSAISGKAKADAHNRSIRNQKAEDRRRRKVFEDTAVDLSGQLGGINANSISGLQRFQDPNFSLTEGLASEVGDFQQDYLNATAAASDLDFKRLLDGLTNKLGAQFGQRAGSEVARAGGEATAEFGARRDATAAGLTPAILQALMGGRVAGANLGLQSHLDPLRMQLGLATHDPTAAPALREDGFSAGGSLVQGIGSAFAGGAPMFMGENPGPG